MGQDWKSRVRGWPQLLAQAIGVQPLPSEPAINTRNLAVEDTEVVPLFMGMPVQEGRQWTRSEEGGHAKRGKAAGWGFCLCFWKVLTSAASLGRPTNQMGEEGGSRQRVASRTWSDSLLSQMAGPPNGYRWPLYREHRWKTSIAGVDLLHLGVHRASGWWCPEGGPVSKCGIHLTAQNCIIQVWVYYCICGGWGHGLGVIQWKEWVMEIIGFPSYLSLSNKVIQFSWTFWRDKMCTRWTFKWHKRVYSEWRVLSLPIPHNPDPFSRDTWVSHVFWKCSKPIKQFYINVSALYLLSFF